eukprot:g1267.t1
MGTFGFVGAGAMAEAIIRGMVGAGTVTGASIAASDPFEPRHAVIVEAAPGAFTTKDNADVVARSDVVVLSVKPQMVRAVVDTFAKAIDPSRHVVVSIAAGVSTASLEALLPPSTHVVRVMPNTPCLVSETAAALCRGAAATAADANIVEKMMTAGGGRVFSVPETQMDAVTGLSGSGPAYVYLVIEALADGGVRAGLPRDVAHGLATQTVLGAAMMVRETGRHPGALKDQVCSPGGTTIAGVHALEGGGLRAALMDAVVAACQRSKELSKI